MVEQFKYMVVLHIQFLHTYNKISLFCFVVFLV